MSNEINIADLKSGTPTQESSNTSVLVDPNLEREKSVNADNIVGVGDLGLPEAEKPVVKDDYEKGLDLIDKYVEKKKEEVEQFNDAIEANGGQLSEMQWRAMNGEAARSILVDGLSPEEAKNTESTLPPITNAPKVVVEATESIDDELAQLEKEAAEVDGVNETITVSTPTGIGVVGKEESPVQLKPAVEVVAETSAVTEEATAPTIKDKGVVNTSKEIKSSEIDDIDADLKLLDGVEEAAKVSTANQDDFNARLKVKIQEKIIRKNVVPIEAYRIATDHPANVNSIVERRKAVKEAVFKWELFHTGSTFTMRKFNASELDELYGMMQSRSTNIRRMFELIYDHIVDGRGLDFVSWAKCINRLDVNDLWMGVYGACFQFSNYLPYDCIKCKNVMITDSTPIIDMVKYKNDEVKAKFHEIMELQPGNVEFGKTRVTAITPISPTLAIKTKEPSLYDTVIEPLMLDDAFSSKYDDIIQFIPFIEEIYLIDPATQTLRPVTYRIEPNNNVKTLKFKILTWAKIIRPMESDEKGMLVNAINTINNNDALDDIKYCLPAVTCDQCREEIAEDVIGAAELVFIRHQLTGFGAV